MNWLEGNTDYYSSEYLTGMEMAYPERWKKLIGEKNSAALIRRRPAFGRPVVIISGGAANGPLFPGYVGEGLADAAVVGGAYSAPNAYAIYETGKYIDSGHGVLLLYNNFAGDYLNNDMAEELLAMDGIPVESVWTTDDIASALGEEKSARSGRTGIALMIKLAGSCLSEGYTLHQAAELLRKANERTATLSMRVDFSDRKVYYGEGFSGEPGYMTAPCTDMSSLARQATEIICDDLKPKMGERLTLLVNRMRMTSYSDSFMMTRRVLEVLSREYNVIKTRTANYSNIIDIYGFDITVMKTDAEMEHHLRNDIATDSFMI